MYIQLTKDLSDILWYNSFLFRNLYSTRSFCNVKKNPSCHGLQGPWRQTDFTIRITQYNIANGRGKKWLVYYVQCRLYKTIQKSWKAAGASAISAADLNCCPWPFRRSGYHAYIADPKENNEESGDKNRSSIRRVRIGGCRRWIRQEMIRRSGRRYGSRPWCSLPPTPSPRPQAARLSHHEVMHRSIGPREQARCPPPVAGSGMRTRRCSCTRAAHDNFLLAERCCNSWCNYQLVMYEWAKIWYRKLAMDQMFLVSCVHTSSRERENTLWLRSISRMGTE